MQFNKNLTKLLVISLCLISLSGCGKNNSETLKNQEAKSNTKIEETSNVNKVSEDTSNNDLKNYVFREDSSLFKDTDYSSFYCMDNGFYTLTSNYFSDETNEEKKDIDEVYYSERDFYDEYVPSTVEYSFNIYDNEGVLKDSFSVTGKESDLTGFQFIDTDKNIYSLNSIYNDESKEELYITKINNDGEIVYKEYISPMDDSENDYYFIRNITKNDSLLYFFDSDNNIYSFNEESKEFDKIVNMSLDEFFNCNIKVLSNNTLGIIYENYSKDLVNSIIIDVNEKKVISENEAIIDNNGLSFFNSNFVDFIVKTSDSLYFYNFEDNSLVKILDFIASDLNSNDISYVYAKDDSVLYMVNASTFDENIMYRYIKVLPEDVKDKKTIIVGVDYVPYNLKNYFIDYNKHSESYRFIFKDYSETKEGLDLMDKDIISGNIPDIIICSNYSKIKNFASKGMLEDLTSYIDKDENLRNNLQSNILDALKFDDKGLYFIVPSYTFSTGVMKKSVYEDLGNYSIDSVNAYLKENNMDASSFFGFASKENKLNDLLYSSSFIDYKNAKAYFDSDEFINALELIGSMKDSDELYGNWDEDSYMASSYFYRENKYIVDNLYLSDFNDYKIMRYGTFGEDLSYVGFPGEELKIRANSAYFFAISASSEYKDACFDMLSVFLNDEYQEQIYEWEFPINKTFLEKKIEKAKKGSFWINEETGEKEYYEDVFYLNDEEILLPTISDKDIEEVLNLNDKIYSFNGYDDTLNSIVIEESEAYFSGQKTASEVAKIIQNRVNIYLAEQY